jgi:hypothetical protein
MTIVEVLFAAGLLLPPAVLVLSAIALAWPRRRAREARPAARHAHA